MKCHTGVDAGSGFVHTVEVTAANVYDVTVAAKLLREDDEVVYGGNAYLGLEKREKIKQDPQLAAIEYRIDRRPGRLLQISDNAIDWERYIEERRSSVRCKVKPLTYQSYQSMIKNHITPAIGAVKLQAVKGTHIQRLYDSMTRAGLSGKTVKNVSAVLHKAFSVAMKQGIIAANPCDAAELPKVERHEIKPLADDEIPMFLSAIDGSPMCNAYALCLFAGSQEGERLGSSWKQVDCERGRITVSQQLQEGKTKGARYYIAPTTRSGKPRTIGPPPIAFQCLRAERVKQMEDRLKAGSAWDDPDDLVFTDEAGKYYAIHTFYKRFKAIASGADIKSVQDLLGHATASFTLNVYAHTSEQMMRDTAARMQNYYDGLAARG